MSAIATPGQLTRRAEFYHQLAQFTHAGVPLIQSLQMLARSSRSLRGAIQSTVNSLNRGFTLAEALKNSGDWIPAFDIALLQAGEQSGRLDAVFRLLADYYTNRGKVARELISALLYPAFLLHFAIVIFAIPDLFLTGDVKHFLAQTLGVLLPIYVLVGIGVYAAQGNRGETWRAILESLVRPIPLLGSAMRSLALARLAAALEALLSAGVTVIEAWELAVIAGGSPSLRRAVTSWKPRLLNGNTPAEEVSRSREFPELFANLYTTGELSGKLDETLRRLHTYYLEEGSHKLRTLTAWFPKLVYLLVAGMIAYRVIKFYLGYFKQIQDAGGF